MSDESFKTESRVKAFLERYKFNQQKIEKPIDFDSNIIQAKNDNQATQTQNDNLTEISKPKIIREKSELIKRIISRKENNEHIKSNITMKENNFNILIPANEQDIIAKNISHPITKQSNLQLNLRVAPAINYNNTLPLKIETNKSYDVIIPNSPTTKSRLNSLAILQLPINVKKENLTIGSFRTSRTPRTPSLLGKSSSEASPIRTLLINKELAKKRFVDKLKHFSKQGLTKRETSASKTRGRDNDLMRQNTKANREDKKKYHSNSNGNTSNFDLKRRGSCNSFKAENSLSPRRTITPHRTKSKKFWESDNKTKFESGRKSHVSKIYNDTYIRTEPDECQISDITVNKMNDKSIINSSHLFSESSQKLHYLNEIIGDNHKFKYINEKNGE